LPAIIRKPLNLETAAARSHSKKALAAFANRIVPRITAIVIAAETKKTTGSTVSPKSLLPLLR
jgi:hypothetical protein